MHWRFGFQFNTVKPVESVILAQCTRCGFTERMDPGWGSHAFFDRIVHHACGNWVFLETEYSKATKGEEDKAQLDRVLQSFQSWRKGK